MKVLVTGGAGFIGSHVVRRVPARGPRGRSRSTTCRAASKENLDPRVRLRRAGHPQPRGRGARSRAERPQVHLPPRRADGRAPLAWRTRASTPRRTSSACSTCSRRARQARREEGHLQLHRRRHLRRAGRLPRARDPPHAAGLPLRRLQGRGRAVPRLLPGAVRPALRRAALRQRLRPAAEPARRGGRGGDLQPAAGQREALHHLRRRASRRATSSSGRTWRAPTTCAFEKRLRGRRSTSAPGWRRTSTGSTRCSPRPPGSAPTAAARAGQAGRADAHPASTTRWRRRCSAGSPPWRSRDGLRRTVDWFRARVSRRTPR